MYFALAYDLWPHLTGHSLPDLRLVRTQLWLWFIGMMVTTLPWHWVGILGQPRRMAYFDYSDPALSPQALPVAISAIGAFILLTSGLLFLFILARAYTASRTDAGPYRFSLPIHPVRSVPLALNSYGIWVALMIGLTVTNYGFPIAALVARQDTSVPAIYVGAQ
jgi:cytochrome c oxidase subunit I